MDSRICSGTQVFVIYQHLLISWLKPKAEILNVLKFQGGV
jgi:hypothetical protein